MLDRIEDMSFDDYEAMVGQYKTDPVTRRRVAGTPMREARGRLPQYLEGNSPNPTPGGTRYFQRSQQLQNWHRAAAFNRQRDLNTPSGNDSDMPVPLTPASRPEVLTSEGRRQRDVVLSEDEALVDRLVNNMSFGGGEPPDEPPVTLAEPEFPAQENPLDNVVWSRGRATYLGRPGAGHLTPQGHMDFSTYDPATSVRGEPEA